MNRVGNQVRSERERHGSIDERERTFVGESSRAVNSKCYTCVQLPSCVGMENSGGFVFYGWYYATNNSGTKGSIYASMQKDFCGSDTPISTWN